MEKLEFEKKIMDVLIEAGYLKKGQILLKSHIVMELGELPKVDLSFVVTEDNKK